MYGCETMKGQRSENIALIVETIKDWMKCHPNEFTPRAPDVLKDLVLPDGFKYNYTECKFMAFKDLEKSGYHLEYFGKGNTVAKLVDVDVKKLLNEQFLKDDYERDNLEDFVEVQKVSPGFTSKPMKKPDDYSVEDKEKPKFDVALKVR